MTPPAFPLTFRLLPWHHDVTREHVDPLGGYAETYWLPILHPTAFVLGRRFVTLARRENVAAGGTLELDAHAIAHAVGISDPSAPSLAIYGRIIKRLRHYKLLRIHGATIAVKDAWPRLNSGLLSSLTLPMQLAEPDWWALSAGPVAEFVEVPR